MEMFHMKKKYPEKCSVTIKGRKKKLNLYGKNHDTPCLVVFTYLPVTEPIRRPAMGVVLFN